MNDWLTTLKDLGAIAAAAFAVIGGLIGLKRYLDESNERQKRAQESAKQERDTEIRQWQKIIIHELLQKTDDNYLTFDEVYQAYLKEAAKLEKFDIPKGQLSEVSLRRILIEMLADQVIGQTDTDEYFILRHDNGEFDDDDEESDEERVSLPHSKATRKR